MLRILVIGLGGFVGANLRYGLAVGIGKHTFPLGTLAANLIGCFGLAFFVSLADGRLEVSETTKALIGTGLFGALTSFSTFNWEALSLFNDGKWMTALLYVAASLSLGVIGGALGISLARL